MLFRDSVLSRDLVEHQGAGFAHLETSQQRRTAFEQKRLDEPLANDAEGDVSCVLQGICTSDPYSPVCSGRGGTRFLFVILLRVASHGQPGINPVRQTVPHLLSPTFTFSGQPSSRSLLLRPFYFDFSSRDNFLVSSSLKDASDTVRRKDIVRLLARFPQFTARIHSVPSQYLPSSQPDGPPLEGELIVLHPYLRKSLLPLAIPFRFE